MAQAVTKLVTAILAKSVSPTPALLYGFNTIRPQMACRIFG